MKKPLSTLEIARMVGVAIASVSKWIDQGLLRAGKTPGGHRRVQAEDLVDFLRRQKLPIPRGLMPDTPAVLVVDDDKGVAGWVAEEVSTEFPRFRVFQANDGFAAGEVVVLHRPVLVVLDLRMPGMDGYEVCRRIKSRDETRNIVVVAMTAQFSRGVEERILGCGAKICLRKPLDREVLLREVADAAGIRPPGPPAET